eukprot:7263423-Pyramimonas_sp.AAC.1
MSDAIDILENDHFDRLALPEILGECEQRPCFRVEEFLTCQPVVVLLILHRERLAGKAVDADVDVSAGLYAAEAS